MGMTRDELVEEILRALGLYADATNYETRCRAWLNLVQTKTARRHYWNDLKNLNITAVTATSQKIYSLSTDWSLTNVHKIHSIRLISGNESRKLKYIGARRMDTWQPYPEAHATTKTQGYVLWGDNCEFFPIPDVEYTLWIRWSQWPTEFSASDQQCDIANIDDLLIAASVAWGYSIQDDMENALLWAKEAERIYQAALENDEEEPDYQPEPEEFRSGGGSSGSYWLNPFMDSVD